MSTEAQRASVPPRPTTPPPTPDEPGLDRPVPPVPSRSPDQPSVQPSTDAPVPRLPGPSAPADPAPVPRLPGPSAPADPAPVPPPPPASARFPDAPPSLGAPPEAPSETTTRLRPVPDTSYAWGVMTPPPAPPTAPLVGGRPVVTFGQPETYDDQGRPRSLRARLRGRTLAAAGCVVLGLGLIGGAVTGSWLTGDSGAGGERGAFAAAADLWHSVPVDQLFPPTVRGDGAGPGGADRTWTRIAVAPDSDCARAFDPLLRKVLAPVGCERLLRATYTDATQSYVTTVGLLFTDADVDAMRSLDDRFTTENLDRRTDLVPRPYAAKGTVAADFGTEQRASWTVSVLTDAPVVVYAVSGWADGRTVDEPEPAEVARADGATSAPAQSGLGHEAQGLADRVERSLRKNVTSPTERPS
ncbi:hypothetical protein [Streptomyces sp. NPDC057877]|uniref:hypothetical protein n=1 Tax=Streptomyces sp. NPDC057877 TaxID=3346269 RepID=UPI0036A0CFE0